jgi:hypothetical protein
MSKHSKHGRGKHSHKIKNRIRPTQPGVSAGAIQPVSSDISRATAPPIATAPAPPMPAQKRQATSAALPLHYEFISGDLKAIGILTGIVVAILIVLVVFLK